jgi:DHA2 family multidrug resistance protein
LFFVLDTLELKAPEKTTVKPGYLVALFSFALFILSSQYIFDFGREKGWFSSAEIQLACLLCGAFFIVFVHFNRQAGCSVFDLSLLRSKDYMITTVILGLGNGVIFSSLVLLPLWLQIDYGMPLLQAGGIVAVASAVAAVLAPLVGKKVDTKLYPAMSLLSLSLTGISFYMMSQFTLDTPQSEIVITRLIAGFGLATFTAPLLSLSLAKVGMDKMNEANSLSLSFRLISSNICVALAFSFWQYEHIRLKEQVLADMDKFSYQGMAENKQHWMYTMFEQVTHSWALTNILNFYAILFFVSAVVLAGLFAYQKHSLKSGELTQCQTS